MSDFPEHDEVHVISDIHMGGKPGFQILRETQRLANYIGWVRDQRPGGRVALVLNGDIFDTLAEDIHGYVAVNEAVDTVKRIMGDPSFSGVWKALADFVKLEGRTLVIVIGNHDIEIAFPMVQRFIVSKLTGDDLKARSRIEFSTTGAGYTCTVDNSRIYCTHGNEVDAWNYNRYEDLAKIGRHMNAGKSLDPSEWYPNAGTRMVKEVMNEIKRKFAWIDLLKPETAAAIGTLAVLDSSQIIKINKLLSIVGEKVQGQKQVDQRLSVEGFQQPEQNTDEPVTVDRLLGPNLKAGVFSDGSVASRRADDMLLTAEENYDRADRYTMPSESTLGTPQLIWDRLTGWIRGVPKEEALRRAMKDWLATDKSFDFNDDDDTFKQISAAVGPSIDFIVTGHTHLERAIKIEDGRYYFNCGTWIRLLQFTQEMLKDTASFEEVYKVLSNGTMAAIDNAQFWGKPFVMDQTSAVSIKEENGKVVGRLTHVVGNGTGLPVEIKKFP